jgi:hypothetical protein
MDESIRSPQVDDPMVPVLPKQAPAKEGMAKLILGIGTRAAPPTP